MVGVKSIEWFFLIWTSLLLLAVQWSYCLDDNFNKTSMRLSDDDVESLDEECECIPYYQCNNDYGEDIIILRLKTCENIGDVCCPIVSQPTTTTEALAPKTSIRQNECGIRNVESIGFRLLSANEAGFGEFPWMIAVLAEGESLQSDNEDYKFECGGSLIHPQVVLTAAHCVDQINVTQLRARAGEWDFQTNQEIYPHQDRKLQKVIIHEKFYRGTALYDIALLILDQPFDKTDNLGIICLPRPDTILDGDCIVTGWGMDSTDGELQAVLKQLEMPIVPRDQCQSSLRKTRLGKRFKLHESFMCAGGVVGVDSCQGDGGGPLICPVDDGKEMQYHQVGIVAWGIDCGTEAPGVYVNVLLFLDWIENQLNEFGFTPSFS